MIMCYICGEEVIHPRIKYCSVACYKEQKRRRNKEYMRKKWRENHPNPIPHSMYYTDEVREKLTKNALAHPERQRAATRAALESPISGPFETNYRAKEWHLIAPDGARHIFRNLNLFAKKHIGDNWYNFTTAVHAMQATLDGRRIKNKVYSYKGWRVF